MPAMGWTKNCAVLAMGAVGFTTLAVDFQEAFLVTPATGATGRLPQRVSSALPREQLRAAASGGEARSSSCAIAAAALALVALPAVRRNSGRRSKGARVTACAALQQPSGIAAAATMEVAKNSFAGASLEETSIFSKTSTPKRPVTRHLLMPKQIKLRKPHKPAIKPFHHCTKWKFRGFEDEPDRCKPQFGKYALQALEEAWISNKQIENVRRAIVRTMERKGKMWIRIFPDSGITQRVAESRMGAGKGGLEYWVAAVRPHTILFEVDGVDEDIVRNAFRKASYRLPTKVRMVTKTDGPSRFELGKIGTEKGWGDRKEYEDKRKWAATWQNVSKRIH